MYLVCSLMYMYIWPSLHKQKGVAVPVNHLGAHIQFQLQVHTECWINVVILWWIVCFVLLTAEYKRCLSSCKVTVYISIAQQVIAEGQQKLASVPSGGAVAAAGSSGGGGDDKVDGAEEKKEEKKEESEEESDDDMGFGLFD